MTPVNFFTFRYFDYFDVVSYRRKKKRDGREKECDIDPERAGAASVADRDAKPAIFSMLFAHYT